MPGASLCVEIVSEEVRVCVCVCVWLCVYVYAVGCIMVGWMITTTVDWENSFKINVTSMFFLSKCLVTQEPCADEMPS